MSKAEYDGRKDDTLAAEKIEEIIKLHAKTIKDLKTPVSGTAYQLPKGYQDELKTTTDIDFHWIDRLKIMLGFRVTLTVWTLTENAVGSYKSRSRVGVYKTKTNKGDSTILATRSGDNDYL